MARNYMRGAGKAEDSPPPVALPRGRGRSTVEDDAPRRGPGKPPGKQDKVLVARRKLLPLLHKRELEELSGLRRAFELPKDQLESAVLENWNGEVEKALKESFNAMLARSQMELGSDGGN